MTGFATVSADAAGYAIRLDARSVNGRSLDVRLRLPNGLDVLEGPIRKKLAERFKRGSISLTLSVKRAETPDTYTVNRTQLGIYLAAIQELASEGAVAAPRADGLLALRGVIEAAGEGGEGAEEVEAPDHDLILRLCDDLIEALAQNRIAEGAALTPVLRGRLDEMERLATDIDAMPERQLPAIKARLSAQIDALLADDKRLSDERLHQEAAMLATRADIREELDRLAAHIGACRALLSEGGPIGRKLDFLAQELGRETNTLCAKAIHQSVTAHGLALKAVVEQVREQVQNLQ